MSKIKLSAVEKLIVKLDSIKRSRLINDKERGMVNSFLDFYLVNKFLTAKQVRAAETIIVKVKRTAVKSVDVKYYVYAIKTSRDVKIGFSTNPSKRLLTLQTSSAEKLKMEWKAFAGHSRHEAIKNERALHKICHKYRIGGEWFELDCLQLVKQFQPKYKVRSAVESDTVTITNKMLKNSTTANGGYTKLQLQALGIDWPPKKGWKKSVIGKVITKDQAALFKL